MLPDVGERFRHLTNRVNWSIIKRSYTTNASVIMLTSTTLTGAVADQTKNRGILSKIWDLT